VAYSMERESPATKRGFLQTPLRLLGQPLWPLPWIFVVFVVVWVGMILVGSNVEFLFNRVGRRGWMSGWALTHLLGFMLAAFVLPDHWFLLFWAGFIWEVAEYVVETCFYKSREEYWYSRNYDIVLNAVGIAVGASVRKLISAPNGASRKKAFAVAITAVTFAVYLLLLDDEWKYISHKSRVRHKCGCNKDCDYDLDNAPERNST
jgi:hypothetical protein